VKKNEMYTLYEEAWEAISNQGLHMW